MKHDEKKENPKRIYIPPNVSVIWIEMEHGIAANSAAVSPVTIGGNVDQVQTDWSESIDTTIHTEY